MRSAFALMLAVTMAFFSMPVLYADPINPNAPLYDPVPEKAFVAESAAAPVTVPYTPGLTSTNVTTLPGTPLPYVMAGSSSTSSLSLSATTIGVKYDVRPAGAVSGMTVDFDNYGTAGQETGDLSSLAKITVGLLGYAQTVNVRFEDANGNFGTFELTQVSSSSQRYWSMDLSLLDPALDRSRIKAIHFFVDQTDTTSTYRSGTFYVKLNGLDLAAPALPQADPATSLLTNQTTVTLTGTKEAYSSVYVKGILVALADASTTWTASGVKLSSEGVNSISLVAKSALGISSATQYVKITRDTTAPTGSVAINNGAASTSSVSVTLNLKAADSGSGVDAMRFSMDGGTTWTEWEAFAATRAVTLPSRLGTNEVSYQVRDQLGNTATYKDTIINNDGVAAAREFSRTLEDLLTKPAMPANFYDALFQSRAAFQWALSTYTTAQRTILLSGLSARDQALAKMLFATSQVIAPTISDAQLTSYAANKPSVGTGFDAADFKNNLAVLEGMDPQSVMAFAGLLATPHFSTANPYTTWASQSWAMATMETRYNEFARRSTVAKVLVQEGVMFVPVKTHVYFTWSGAPDIWISLSPVSMSTADIPSLTRLQNSEVEVYRIGATRALAGTVAPAMPALDPATPAVFNGKSVTISGAKDAYSSVYVNGVLVAPADNSTTWSALVTLAAEGNNTVSLVSKSILGVASATRSVILRRDMVAPAGSIKIENGAASTGSLDVILNLTASDATSGVDVMRFTVDGGANWTDWEAFAATRAITLTFGYGTKEVQYQVRDKAGNVATFKDTIVYKFMPATPVVTSTVPAAVNQTSLVLSGTKDAQTYLYINGTKYASDFNATVWTATVSLGTTDGSKTFSITSKTSAGDASAARSLTVLLDRALPTGTIKINNGDTSTGTTDVILNLTAADAAAGLDQVRFTVDAGANWTGWEAFSATRAITLTSGYGTKEVQYQVRDKAGNIATFKDTIVYEFMPGTPAVTSEVPAFTNAAQLILSGTKDAQTYLYINGTQYGADFNATDWSATVSLATDGVKTFSITTKTSTGKMSAAVTVTTVRDTVIPTGSLKINNGATATNSTNVTLALTSGDASSGVDKVRFSADGGANWTVWEASVASKSLTLPSGDGSKQLRYQVSDKAGNIATFSASILLDTVLPAGNIAINGGSIGTQSRTVTLNLLASDAGSGLYQLRYSADQGVTWSAWQTATATANPTVTIPDGDGEKTVLYEISDKAGNIARFSDTIILDRAAPTGTVTVNEGAAYMNDTLLRLSINMTDPLSGMANMRFSSDGTTWSVWYEYRSSTNYSVPAGDGTKKFYAQFRDWAGNTYQTMNTIVLDTVAPTGSVKINNGDATTTSRNVTLQLTGADSSSGVNAMRFSSDGATWSDWEAFAATKELTLSAGTGDKEVRFQMKDKAGNTSAVYTDTITYELGVPAAPSVVTVQSGDRRLWVQNRLMDGSLAPTVAYVSKGVNWSPTSYDTNPSADPQAFLKGFQDWYQTDIPLMAQMGINTVRVYHDFGTDAKAIKILDMFYQYGIKVIVTVDSPLSTVCGDLNNISAVVNAYKNHPAILMWSVGNEWDINRYYGKFATTDAAAAFTEQAAQLIKSLDSNHPVTTAVADSTVAKNASNSTVPSVDVWGINIYRGQSFGEAISQWEAASSKPFYIGEYGGDSYDHRTGAENQTMQAGMSGGLWDEVYFDLSAERTNGAVIGALAFEWSDEWWKNSVDGVHSVSYESNNGQPDGYNDEEWFGIVDVYRQPKQLYTALQDRFLHNAVQTNATPVLTVTSQEDTWRGSVRFKLGEKTVSYRAGQEYGYTGITVAIVDGNTGIQLSDVRTFDTCGASFSGNFAPTIAMMDYINSLPNGTVLAISIADDGGLWSNAAPVVQARQLFTSLGSTKVNNIPLNYGWAFITVKGQGALAEAVATSKMTTVSVQAQLSLTLDPDAGRRPAAAPAIAMAAVPAEPVAAKASVGAELPVLTVTTQNAGTSSIEVDGKTLFRRPATPLSGRGIYVGTVDPLLGIRTTSVKTFSASADSKLGTAALTDYVQGLPDGTIVTVSMSAQQAADRELSKAMESLGSVKIRKMKNLGGWAMIAVKGQGALAEAYSDPHMPVTIQAQLPPVLSSKPARS
ncbi:MAG TPA: interleukin-like EMT inducer domain-containing protein [Candidatus Omnitrophota bacterium]|nr:interleukin-like EMT inducer domain-containing protein [Candidatus Omnitrophota bacterium]HPS36302.1 interleukin-like EMT inducer domain-containing protein [Candidatus Omnitrophota bacterium]